jgi:hypothetical protein
MLRFMAILFASHFSIIRDFIYMFVFKLQKIFVKLDSLFFSIRKGRIWNYLPTSTATNNVFQRGLWLCIFVALDPKNETSKEISHHLDLDVN